MMAFSSLRLGTLMPHSQQSRQMTKKPTHVFPDRSGMESVVQFAVAADIVVRLSRGRVEDPQEKARWTFRGILVKALCIITVSQTSITASDAYERAYRYQTDVSGWATTGDFVSKYQLPLCWQLDGVAC